MGGWRKEKQREEQEDFLENLHVLSCFVQLKIFLLISRVFGSFFSTLAIHCFSDLTVS